MAAYAALLSLARLTKQILSQDQDYAFLCNKEQMLSLHEKVIRLQEFLEHILVRPHSSTLDVLESRIRDVAYQLDYIIESVTCKLPPQPPNSFSRLLMSAMSYIGRKNGKAVQVFSSCIVEINTLLEEATKVKIIHKNKHISAILHSTTSSSREAPNAEVTNVGLNNACTQMLDTITGQTSKLQIIPITGMGGIGKTTLASAVYNNSRSFHHFDVRLWVTISQEYDLQEVLRGLLSTAKQTEQPNGRLIEQVYKYLTSRRFLIVLDDMWHGKAWDGLMNAFPDDNKGSRIILTTRELGVASYVGSLSNVHKMQLLNEDQSWVMLRKKVYGEEPCPAELGDIGRTISRNCKGLPLAIVVIAGILKRIKRKDYWEEVAENINAAAATDYDQLFGILSLSYANLPPQLKACFLYMGAYPEDYEFQVKELVMLWTAEGFLKPREPKTTEDIAEECIEELVERSLFLVKRKNSYNGKIKTFSIHDVLREVSMKKAKEEKFVHHNSISTVQNITNDLHKVSFLKNDLNLNSDSCNAHLRSFKYTTPRGSERIVKSVVLHNFTLTIKHPKPLDVVCKSTNLRYLCVIHRERERNLKFPKLISDLQNLETFITRNDDGANSTIPLDIWKLQRLRHIILGVGCKLQFPAAGESGYPILESLQTLIGVWNVNFSMDVIERIPNVKRLKLFYEPIFEKYDILKKVENRPRKLFSLSNLQHLHRLEELFISLQYYYLLSDLAFPRNLKKLSLYNTNVPLENFVSVIGSLPNLEVLKLRMGSIVPDIWEPVEGEFLELKYLKMELLYIEEWVVESCHFPCLQKLVIVRCKSLKEVPECIGEIGTLEELVLNNSPRAKESVQKIIENQQAFDNDSLKITIIDD